MLRLARADNKTIVMLVQKGFPIEEPIDDVGSTILHLAVQYHNGDLTQQLLNMGASIRTVDKQRRSVLHKACRSGNAAGLQMLTDFSRNAHGEEVLQELLDMRNVGLSTPLMSAIESGDPNVVQLCLNLGMSPYAVNIMGESCLEYAMKENGPKGKQVFQLISTAVGNSESEALIEQQREQVTQLAGPCTRDFIDEMQYLRHQRSNNGNTEMTD